MKNKFDILNDVTNNIDNIEDVILSDNEKQNISNRVKMKINKPNKDVNKKRVIAASLAFMLMGSLLFTNEEVLAQINSMGRKIESFFGKEDESFRKYKKDIIQVTEDKGIKFILNEVVLDDEELYMNASVDYKDFDRSTLSKEYKGDLKIVPLREQPKFEIFLNGNRVDVTGAGGSYKYNEDETVDMLLNLDMKNNNLNEVYDIKIIIDTMEAQIGSNKNEEIAGNWNMDFKVDGNEISKDMKVININKEIELDYKDIKVPVVIEELRISPISMSFKYNTNSADQMNSEVRVEFKFMDENNKEIFFLSKGGNQDGLSYKYIIDRDIKKIKIVPAIKKYSRLWTTEKEFTEEAFEIEIK